MRSQSTRNWICAFENGSLPQPIFVYHPQLQLHEVHYARSVPAIRDRVVQGALKLILEPVFEADFQPGSFGYRPKRTAHGAIKRVAEAIVRRKTRVVDVDLRAYFDNVRHDRLLAKVARRIDDADVMHLLKVMLKASGKKGVPQGGVISPLLSNLYLNEVDKMLERAQEVTRNGKYTYIEYARFADDLVILIDAYKRHDWLLGAVDKRLREELGKLQVEINDEKSRTVDLERGECFGFLGFEFRYLRGLSGAMRPHYTPKLKKRTQMGARNAKSARCVVCPAKAGMFSRRQTCRGRSQSPVVWIAEVMETETLKPIDKVSPGEATSHRAVTKVNALWPRK
jgi:group II intron reverse transcriptase/maturase